ncbi:MAG: PorP/SprF family type IX secretion system membrane protein [Flavobacteriales bacterium]|nr:PorP/SprF family type IX secretion system membrane protein [Flavobacteriales bacterium]
MKRSYGIWLWRRLVHCSVFLLLAVTVPGQDIHFSQFSQTPLLVNPALTGLFNGDIRVHLNYKNQWKSVATPYKTYALSYDMSMLKKKWDHSYLGLGFFAFSDKAGDTEFGTTQFNLSLSGVVSLNDAHRISAGLQGGFAQKSMNTSALQWGNQFDQGTYDPSLAPAETSDFSPFTHGDFSAGLNWNFLVGEQTMTNAGVALFHVNKPQQEFVTLSSERLYSRLVVHLDGHIGIANSNWAFLPSILYLNQGPSTEINFGTMVRYQLREESKYTGYITESAVSLGGHYRNGDSFIPSILIEVANFALGISYDINVSGLNTVSNGRGGFEIVLRYINPNPLKRVGSQGPSFP